MIVLEWYREYSTILVKSLMVCQRNCADDLSFRYPLSKLLVIFAVRELANLLPVSESGVVLNSVNPGICKTDLSRNAPAEFRKQLAEMHEKFGRTAEDGSRTLLHGAVAGKDSHGIYLSDCEIAE
jgi:NAD(P)-dependent dehydrogenase (short-subunit alcohol dehydrogenase family)